jgi:hypothetical protein
LPGEGYRHEAGNSRGAIAGQKEAGVASDSKKEATDWAAARRAAAGLTFR